MDIQHIREFITVAQYHNLPTAADQHYVSPSLLSLHIRKLEEELGYPLFNRTSRTLVLNERGRLFLPYAKKIVHAYDSYRETAEKASAERDQQLCLGMIGSVSQPSCENLIVEFYKHNSDIRLYIKSRDESQTLLNFLRNEECDFLFLYEADVPFGEFAVEHLFTDRIVAVVPPDHPLAQRRSICVSEIQTENILMQNANNNVFQKIMSYTERHGAKLNVSFALNAHSLMEDMLQIGAGIGLMPYSSARDLGNKQFSLLPLDPPLTIEFSLLYIKKSVYSPAEERFLHYIHRKFGPAR